ncbi:MAG: hypothetical protein H0W06_09765 [Chloroflexia bacterium]|nr:hypothetical protein [Chloroflexia bacterium]
MRQLVYALRFHGEARRIGVDGNVLAIATTATGGTIRCQMGLAGIETSLRPDPRGEAACEAELVLTGKTMFQQAGTIAFGTAGHRLRLSTVGSGHLGPGPAANLRHGAAIWRVEWSARSWQ